MLPLLAILILLVTPLSMLLLHLWRPRFAYQWLVAVGAAFVVWLVLLLSSKDIPRHIPLVTWEPVSLFPSSPALLVDEFSFPFALALATLILGIMLTAVVRLGGVDWRVWAGNLILAGLGILAVLAGNPLTLLLGWSALDIVETLIILSQVKQSARRASLVIAISARVGGIAMLLLGGIVTWSKGETLTFATISSEASPYLLLAAGLRLGVLPIHLPFLDEVPLRRGLGTSLRLVPAAASLILLVRTATVPISASLSPYLLALSALAALYGAVTWVTSTDELSGRPSWLLGMASLAMAAAILAQPQASLAWGIASLLSGGLLFLMTPRQRNLLPLPILGLISFSALPFTPAWGGTYIYMIYASPGFAEKPLISAVLTPILLLAHALLLAGYLRHSLRQIDSLEVMERWMWLIYPVGLALFPITHFLLGVWTWPQPTNLPFIGWIVGVLALGLATLPWLWKRRTTHPLFVRLPDWGPSLRDKAISLNWLYRPFWAVYLFLGQLLSLISSILEGDGGILWALVLLVLIITLLNQ